MQKDFDMKVQILKVSSLESEVKKLKQILKIKKDDPIFKKEDPERIITIRKKKYWKKARALKKAKNISRILNKPKTKKQSMIKPEKKLTIR